jgi:hypothetical protein
VTARRALPRQQRLVDPIAAFRLRCEARALLWHAGEFDLAEAVDVLQLDAERTGLLEQLGPDAVQAILAEAFSVYRESSQ